MWFQLGLFQLGTFLLLVAQAVTNPNPWCSSDYDCRSLFTGKMCKHTMCLYGEQVPSECEGWRHGLTDREKGYILDLHNNLRAKVARGEMDRQPGATDMMRMEWDDNAEVIAQRWASQCRQRGHDDCNASWEGEKTGQNYARKGHSQSWRFQDVGRNQDLEEMFNDWIYKEVGNVYPQYVSRFPWNSMSLDIGHYTQIVWAKTTRLGCGLAHLLDYDGTMFNCEYKLICNYLIMGNTRDFPIYLQGNNPATKCPEGTVPSKKYPGLCEYQKKYHDFSEPAIPADTSKVKPQQPNPTQPRPLPAGPPVQKKPTRPIAKPSGQTQLPKTSSKPPQKPATSSIFGFELKNIPVVGRWFTDEPEGPSQGNTPNKTPAKAQSHDQHPKPEFKPKQTLPLPASESKPQPQIDLTHSPSGQKQRPPIADEGYGTPQNTESPSYSVRQHIIEPTDRVDTESPTYRVRQPITEPTDTVDTEIPSYRVRQHITEPTDTVDVPKVTQRPTLDDEFQDTNPMPNYSVRKPPVEPTDGIYMPQYSNRYPTDERSRRFEFQVHHVPRSDPFESMRRRHEDFVRTVQEDHSNFMRRFEESSGIPSSMFEPDTFSPYRGPRLFDRMPLDFDDGRPPLVTQRTFQSFRSFRNGMPVNDRFFQ